ncbi:hypothetical protein ACIQZB_32355 [Streptomyces sp. NPDC097727]|uniref:hypothetical protein n=1 Tax=Streptomyces sp. NPDC097727 TaxID=3366092 RepID=UPI003825F473
MTPDERSRSEDERGEGGETLKAGRGEEMAVLDTCYRVSAGCEAGGHDETGEVSPRTSAADQEQGGDRVEEGQ